MKISVKAEYALQAVFDLATQPAGEPIRIADIAKRQKIPQKFLELILSNLKQGGFVESRRGADGGYMLARPAAQIMVGEVIRHVDGPNDRRLGAAGFEEMWQQVDEAVQATLGSTSFQQLAESWQTKQSQYVANWEI
ncbi:RrF2 family transcriptional regulator [Bryobacter aggregatus]|uniref:RrF2 family transcriptional regulator n=1 Tax=Bryobacter aggregatus TaxID=360054 RepID=UPI0004E2792D|nr:Rrf2 family transcriptional regulator [Bryobacter aggregatus]